MKVQDAIIEAQKAIQQEYKDIAGREIDPRDGTAQLTMIRASDLPRARRPSLSSGRTGGILSDIELTLRAQRLYGQFIALEDLAIRLNLPAWRAK